LNEPLEVLVVLSSVLDPLIGNLLEDPENEKFRKVRLANPHVGRALAVLGIKEFLHGHNFVPTEDGYLQYQGDRLQLAAAQRSLRHVRARVEERVNSSAKAITTDARKQEILARAQQEQQALARELDMRRAAKEEAERLRQDDITVGKSLESVALHTLHKTHRIRNHLRDALHLTCVRMRTGRTFVECTTCDPSGLEVHWHTRTSNMLYAYVVHLTPDALTVVHNGPVLGFMYDTDPKSETFGSSVMFSKQHPDLTGREGAKAQLRFSHESTVVTKCPYCMKDFAKELWV
jgi:hypothetical protein